MSNKSKFTPYLISLAIGLAVAATIFSLLMASAGVETFQKPRMLFSKLTDATFVTGVIFACIGVLTFAGREGTFDGLGFAFESIFVVRNWSPRRKFEERETFADYKDRKAEKRKEKKPFSHFFVTGGFYIVLAIIFLIVYYSIPTA